MGEIDPKNIETLFNKENEDFNATINRESQFLDWDRAGVLFDQHLIPSQQGIYMEIIVRSKDKKEPVFEMEWAIFDEVAYINWIRINEKYRRCGISSSVRQQVINWLFRNGCREVFTIPASKAGEKLVESQGFSKTQIQPESDEYVVYSKTR